MFTKSEDIANRALQHVGAPRINNFSDVSKQAAETGFCYDKLRRSELRRSVWRFATRRAVIRVSDPFQTVRIVPPPWAAGTDYTIGRIVQDDTGIYWIAMVPGTAAANNAPGIPIVGQQPYWQQYFGTIHPNPYSALISYYAGEMVYQSGVFYTSLYNGNLAVTLDNTGWWVPQVGMAAQSTYPLVPAGPNVTINGRARNMFSLPYGFLRATYPDPKVESTATNVTSAGLRFSDWQFENNYLISHESDPIILRFVADISDVSTMDDLFCEGLAARIAYEVCESITQSNIKLQAIASAYQKFISDARLINWLETGATESQEQEYQLSQGPAGVAEPPGAGGEQGGR